MRSTGNTIAPIVTLFVLLASGALAHDQCEFDPDLGRIVCEASGIIPGPDPGPVDPPIERPPQVWLYTRIDAGGGECWYLSAVPGGLDVNDPANEAEVLQIMTLYSECPAGPGVPPLTGEAVEARAWAVFRAFPLAPPVPALEPAAAGITGLPTHLAAATPGGITHSEVLPDGRTLEVAAAVGALVVDWGDGNRIEYDPGSARPYPAGGVAHAYALKTCPPEYRINHPSGGSCHPTLEAYPITASFTWQGRYRIGAGWVDLGALNRTTTITYDVDEVVGVLQP